MTSLRHLVFASNNQHKVAEIQEVLPPWIVLQTLKDIGCNEELPETSPTIEGNAIQKAQYLYDKYHSPCFADDTGLEIEALGGRPGVYSARYAGPNRAADANMKKVLEELQGIENRNAQFKTVIALMLDGNPVLFEGVVKGVIANKPMGVQGFGYDPIFRPLSSELTFAEMPIELKNTISHRALAAAKLVDFLKHHI